MHYCNIQSYIETHTKWTGFMCMLGYKIEVGLNYPHRLRSYIAVLIHLVLICMIVFCIFLGWTLAEYHEYRFTRHRTLLWSNYSGTPLYRTPLGLGKVAGLARCPLFRGC